MRHLTPEEFERPVGADDGVMDRSVCGPVGVVVVLARRNGGEQRADRNRPPDVSRPYPAPEESHHTLRIPSDLRGGRWLKDLPRHGSNLGAPAPSPLMRPPGAAYGNPAGNPPATLRVRASRAPGVADRAPGVAPRDPARQGCRRTVPYPKPGSPTSCLRSAPSRALSCPPTPTPPAASRPSTTTNSRETRRSGRPFGARPTPSSA